MREREVKNELVMSQDGSEVGAMALRAVWRNHDIGIQYQILRKGASLEWYFEKHPTPQLMVKRVGQTSGKRCV
jgi:hypothetical protein